MVNDWPAFLYMMHVVGTNIYKIGWTKPMRRGAHPVEDRCRRLTKRRCHDLDTRRFRLLVLEFAPVSGQSVETDCHHAMTTFHIELPDVTNRGQQTMTEYFHLTLAHEVEAARTAISYGHIPILAPAADTRQRIFTKLEFVAGLPAA